MSYLRARGDVLEGVDLEPDVALERLERRPGEPDAAYVRRAVDAVHRSLVHHHDPERADLHRWHVPPRENVFLWLGGFANERVAKYAFCDHRRAIERGVGFCGQCARALTSALRENGVECRPVAFPRHVVTEAVVGGERWVLDANLRTVIPHSLEAIGREPEIVREYYAREGRPQGEGGSVGVAKLDELVEIFAGPPGRLSPPYELQRVIERVLYRLHPL